MIARTFADERARLPMVARTFADERARLPIRAPAR